MKEANPKGTFEKAAITALAQWHYAPLAKPLSNILTRFDLPLKVSFKVDQKMHK